MTEGFLATRAVLVTLCVLMIIMFASANLPWQLDDYDQAKQAYTSFEMVKAGHWLYQHTPHERIATKPPLIGWISAGLFEMTRSWDLAWRLPSLGAAIVLAILLFRAGSVYGDRGGIIAMSAFAFNLLTPRLASLVRTDMPLALAVSAIGLLIWRKIREGHSWQRRDRVLLFVLLTAAMLIKGPIVYAFLLPGILLIVWIARDRIGEARRCGWWPWIASLSIFLVWAIAGSIWIPNFYDQVVRHEFLGRFGETAHRPQPFYFYWPHLLHKFAPWSVLTIVIAAIDLSARRKLDRLNRSSWKEWLAGWEIAPETVWLVGWAIGGLVVMSLIPSKRVDRIFPIIPPLCLLVAAQLANRRASVYRWAALVTVMSILYAGGYAAFKIYTGYCDHRDALEKFGRLVRDAAAVHHWRYDVVNASDEGLLLYLQKLHFVRPPDAIAEWNRGDVDALVVSEKEASDFVSQLQNASISAIKSLERKDQRGNYVLITR